MGSFASLVAKPFGQCTQYQQARCNLSSLFLSENKDKRISPPASRWYCSWSSESKILGLRTVIHVSITKSTLKINLSKSLIAMLAISIVSKPLKYPSLPLLKKPGFMRPYCWGSIPPCQHTHIVLPQPESPLPSFGPTKAGS